MCPIISSENHHSDNSYSFMQVESRNLVDYNRLAFCRARPEVRWHSSNERIKSDALKKPNLSAAATCFMAYAFIDADCKFSLV